MSALAPFSPATRTWFERTFAAPTPVQSAGWGPIAGGKHALLLAPTGSGKTLAAFLAAIDRLARLPADAEPGVRVLYVSPLKALVYDVDRNLRAPLVGIEHAAIAAGQDFRPIRVDVRTGDTSQRDRRAFTKNPGDILVTTPESLFLLLGSQAREHLTRVETIIVDEIHAIAGKKRGVHMALTLERLAAQCQTDPQRVGLSATQRPLEEIARFLGGDRPVDIVDTSEPPDLSLEIIVPVDDMTNPVAHIEPDTPKEGAADWQYVGSAYRATTPGQASPGGPPRRQESIWPTIYPRIIELIRSHRSTIVFTNSRILCERLAQRLNELVGDDDFVRAHHGSVAREQREQIEEALKQGRVPAIIATSSLELGIDMGAVDLVIQVESPGSVARGLQRIGRAGHGVGERSEGRIFPKFRGDLLESAVVSGAMVGGRIESTSIPRNCLDVLAQQIVSMTAGRTWKLDELEALVRRAYPYRELSRGLLVSVLDMLSGRYPSDEFADLPARITWDRTKDELNARKGAGTLALLNAGTIPDRGLFGVFLVGDGPRIGELDEEMVFESRRGDNVILGATTWRIEEITRDRVVVSPAPGEPGRLPFWKGDRPGRPVDLGRELGAFVRKVGELGPKKAPGWIEANTPCDERAAKNLTAYITDQKEATGALPTDRVVLIERFRDELGDWRVCILSPFGTRVNIAWSLALQALIASRAGHQVQTMYTDDGIVLRFADIDDPPGEDLLIPDPEEVEDLVVEQLGSSAVFAGRFREAAARSLLLPRKRYGKRTPLWLQRIRSQNLMSQAQRFPQFPIILETYRECLRDVLDVPALKALLQQIRSREIRVEEVETRSPSPMARSLVFAYVAAYLYETDAPLAERKAQALTLDRGLLAELLGQEELRELLDAEVIASVEAELQWLDPERRATDVDRVHDLLRKLGALPEAAILDRCTPGLDPAELHRWLQDLAAQRRVYVAQIAGEPRWIAAQDAARYRDALGIVPAPGLPAAFLEATREPLEGLLLRYARTHAPFTDADIAGHFGLLPAQVTPVLRGLENRGLLVHGELRPGGSTREWCDSEVLRRLRRRTLGKLRKSVAPVDAGTLARFLPRWHGLDSKRGGVGRLQEVIDQLEGLPIPFSALESEVLPSRVPGYGTHLLDELGAYGDIVWIGRGALGSKDGKVAIYRRERVAMLAPAPQEAELGELHQAILGRLEQRGAAFLVQLHQATPDVAQAELVTALWDLVWAGLVTNDTFQPLRSLRARKRKTGKRGRGSRGGGGRWSLVSELLLDRPSDTECAMARANMLLERYGVASREGSAAEGLPGGFSSVYPVLREMEERGQARRGWFVEGLSGAQFARPGTVDRLRDSREGDGEVRVLAVTDPANPWGTLLEWPASGDAKGKPRRVAGAVVVMVDGNPVLYVGKGSKRVLTFGPARDEDTLRAALDAWCGREGSYKTTKIEKIDGVPAQDCEWTAAFVRSGFAVDYSGLVRST